MKFDAGERVLNEPQSFIKFGELEVNYVWHQRGVRGQPGGVARMMVVAVVVHQEARLLEIARGTVEAATRSEVAEGWRLGGRPQKS